LEDVLSKALKLYKLKHPKKCFISIFALLAFAREVPRWSDSMEARKTPPPKHKTHNQDSTSIEVEELQDFEVVELGSKNSDCKLLHWPQGSRATKENQRNAKFKECVLRAQAKANVNTWQ
jgi:hypothetical protein